MQTPRTSSIIIGEVSWKPTGYLTPKRWQKKRQQSEAGRLLMGVKGGRLREIHRQVVGKDRVGVGAQLLKGEEVRLQEKVP